MAELFVEDKTTLFPVHKIKYENTENMSLEDVFKGYEKLYAMTYSYSMGFLDNILKWFNYAEIIIGMEDIEDVDISNIGALQTMVLDELKPYVTKSQYNIYKMINEGRLDFKVSGKISHGKLYLCEGENKKRVITGSANMSMSAFSGKQNEIIFGIDDDSKGYEVLKNIYDNTSINSSHPLEKECFIYEGNRANFSDTEIYKRVIKANCVIINDVTPIKERNMVDMVFDLKKRKEKLDEIISDNDVVKERGKILLTAEKFKRIGEREQDVTNIEQEEIATDFIIDLKNNTAYLNDEDIINNYDNEKVVNDINIFNEHLDGFKKHEFTGDTDELISQYCKLLNYMFVSPFFSIFRNIHLRRGEINTATDRFPLFAVVYGQSGGGKTNTINLILKMMNEKCNIVNNEKFNMTVFKSYRMDYKGLPVYIDDVKENPWKNNSGDIIKNDNFGKKEDNYSCFVLSLNNVGNVSDEVKRRSAMFYINCRHKDSNRFKGYGDKIGLGISNNFYKKYITKMFEVLRELYEKTISKEIDDVDLFDISSKIIIEIVGENNKYFKELNWLDYFNTRIISKAGIEILYDAYLQNKKSFIVDKKRDIVIYKNEVIGLGTNKKITDELPTDYEARYTVKGITVKYNKLKLDFKERGIKI